MIHCFLPDLDSTVADRSELGEAIFPGKTTAMVHKAILDANPAPPSKVVASLPEGVD